MLIQLRWMGVVSIVIQSSSISYTSSNGISVVGRIRIKDLVGVQSLYDMKVGGSINDRLIVYALNADIYVEALQEWDCTNSTYSNKCFIRNS